MGSQSEGARLSSRSFALILLCTIRLCASARFSNGTAINSSTISEHASSASASFQPTTSTSSSSVGLGNYIVQGLGGTSKNASTTTAQTTTAISSRLPQAADGNLTFSNSALQSLYNAVPWSLWAVNYTSPSTAPAWTVPSNGSGFLYASRCNQEQELYASISAGSSSESTATIWTTMTNWTAKTTTLCDGIARIAGTLTPVASTSSRTTSTTALSYTGPSPSCSIDANDCATFRTSWSSASSAYTAWTNAWRTTAILAANATAFTAGNSVTGFNTTTFTSLDGSLPTLTIGGYTYTADAESSYKLPDLPYGTIPYLSASGYGALYLMPNFTQTIMPPPITWVGDWQAPLCTASQSNTGACGQCTIGGGNVRLLYFPAPKNATRNQCALTLTTSATVCPFGSTTPATTKGDGYAQACSYYPFNQTNTTDSGPYIVSDGHTFYENRAYISLETAYATNGCGRVGSSYAGTIITVHSSDIYSLQSTDDHNLNVNYATPFNFADLNPNVPAVAYRGAMSCTNYDPPSPAIQSAFGGYENLFPTNNSWYNGSFGAEWDFGRNYAAWVNGAPMDECNVIVDAGYAPVLAVPPQIRTLDPAWAECGLNLNGLYDPPTALTAVATEVSVTKPTAVQTTTAEPSSAVSSAAPQTSMVFTYATTSNTDPATASTQTQVLQPSSSIEQHSSAQQESSTSSDPNAGSGSAATDPALSVSTSVQHTTVIIVSSSSLVDPTSGQGQASELAGSAQDPAVQSTAGDPTTQAQSQVKGSSTSEQSPASPAQATTLAFSDSQPSSQGASTANVADPGQSNTQAAEGGQGSTQDPQASGAASSTSVFFTYAGPTETAAQSASELAPVGTTIVVAPGANSADPDTDASTASQQSAPVTLTYEAGGQILTATQVASTSNVLNFGGQTLSAGGAPAAIGSNTVSLGSGGSLVVNGGQATEAAQAGVQASASTLTYAVGSDTFTAVQASSAPNAISIGGQTITAGGAPVTVDGNTISVGSTGGLVVNGGQATQASQTDVQASAGAVTYAVGSNTFTAVQASGASNLYSIGGTTLSEGGAPATAEGTTYSLGASGLVVNGQGATAITSETSGGGSGASLTIVGVGGSSGAIAVNGATLYDGGSATVISGVTLSAGSSGLVVDQTRTVPVAMPSRSQAGGSAAAVTIGSQVYTAAAASGSGDGLVIGGQTLSAGGPAVTIGGHTVSDGASGLVIDGTQTVALSASAAAQTTKPEAVLTLGSETLTAAEIASGSITDIIIGSYTLSPGSETTINGIDISAGRSGLVIGGTKTVGLSSQATASASAHFITLNGHTLTVQYPATAGGDAVVDGVTMTAGEQTTVDGFVVSEGTSGVAFSALTINRSVNDSATVTSSSSSSQSELPSVLITTSSHAAPTSSMSEPSTSTKTKNGAGRFADGLQSVVTWSLMSVVIVMLM